MPIPSGARYRVGNVEVAVVNDGTFGYDAGAVFGVVPRLMWERVVPPLDAMHRRPLEVALPPARGRLAKLGNLFPKWGRQLTNRLTRTGKSRIMRLRNRRS